MYWEGGALPRYTRFAMCVQDRIATQTQSTATGQCNRAASCPQGPLYLLCSPREGSKNHLCNGFSHPEAPSQGSTTLGWLKNSAACPPLALGPPEGHLLPLCFSFSILWLVENQITRSSGVRMAPKLVTAEDLQTDSLWGSCGCGMHILPSRGLGKRSPCYLCFQDLFPIPCFLLLPPHAYLSPPLPPHRLFPGKPSFHSSVCRQPWPPFSPGCSHRCIARRG